MTRLLQIGNRIPTTERGWNLPVVYNRIVKKKVGWAPEASNEDPNESVTVFFACARIRLVYRTYNIKDVMKSIIDTYNKNSHRTLKNKSPNQIFKDTDDQMTRHLNVTVHNQKKIINRYQSWTEASSGKRPRAFRIIESL